MLDIAVAYNRYRFLGDEFLTWIWYLLDNDPALLRQWDPELAGLGVGNRMVLENRTAAAKETITIKGDSAGLEEGLVALGKGAMVSEINLVYKSGAQQYQFSLKGESLSLSGCRLPETGARETPDEIEGIVLEKLFLYEKVGRLIDTLYHQFIALRLSENWQRRVTPEMKKWVASERG